MTKFIILLVLIFILLTILKKFITKVRINSSSKASVDSGVKTPIKEDENITDAKFEELK